MITEMRKQFRSTATRIILLLTSGALALSLVVPVFMRKQIASGPWILRVNSQDVSYKEFARELNNKRQLVASIRARFGAHAEQLLASMGLVGDPRSNALESVTYNELIAQAARKSGIVLHEDFVLSKLQDEGFINRNLADFIPSFLIKNGVIDQALLKESLRRQGLNMADFEQKLYDMLARNILLEAISSTVYVPRFEKELNRTQELAKRSYAIINFSLKDALKEVQKTEVTSQDLLKFFDEQNKAVQRYQIPEKRAGKAWKFDTRGYGAVPSMDDIRAYYDAHKSQKYIDEQTKITVRHIVLADEAAAKNLQATLLEKPELFEAKAKELSLDKESSLKGGLIAPFSRGQKEESIERAAFLLKKDGDISSIIKTNAGYEIIQRVARKNITYKPIETVSHEIKDILSKRLFQSQFAQEVKKIVTTAVNASEVADFVAKKNGIEQVIPLSSKTSDRRMQEIFHLSKNNYGFYVEGDSAFLVYLSTIEKAHFPDLKSIESVVKNDFYEQKAYKLLEKKALEARALLVEKSPQEVAQLLGASLYQTPLISHDDKDAQGELEKRHIAFERLLSLDRIGLLTSYNTAEGLHVARLEKIEEMKDLPTAGKEQEIEKTLERENTQFFAQGILASLYRNATIETNPTVLQL